MKNKKILKRCNLVLEGGGTKGSALIGALKVIEEEYTVERIAGTSAGAIVASLYAAGYRADELKKIMDELDYKKFRDQKLFTRTYNLVVNKGIYKGEYFEEWLFNLLALKGVRNFGDLALKGGRIGQDYSCYAITSDITNGRLVVLPNGIRNYGILPDSLPVYKAIRMSMSIPFYYRPVKLKHAEKYTYFVDGGVLSNYPVWLFDTGIDIPTFGLKLVEPNEGKPAHIAGPVSFLSALFSTMIEAHDKQHIEEHNFARTIPIPTLGISTTDFGIGIKEKNDLYRSGVEAAKKFFGAWDYGKYKRAYGARLKD